MWWLYLGCVALDTESLPPAGLPPEFGQRSWPAPSTAAHLTPGPRPRSGPEDWDPGRGRTVVIGGGLAGMATAMDLPGKVVLLEADTELGGRARWAGGRIFFVGTEEAEAAGFEVSVDALLEDWSALTGEPPGPVTERFLRESDAVRDRLVGLGVSFAVAETDPIVHRWVNLSTAGGGPALVAALAAALPPEVEVRLGTPATGLLLDDGRVVGVEVGETVIAAERVVIATGGFVNRADLLERVLPFPPGTWGTGSDAGAQGQALDWADAYGLGTDRLDAIGFNADVLGAPGSDGRPIGFEGGTPWVWVDAAAQRFVDESATWSVEMGGARRRAGVVWAVSTWEQLEDHVDAADATSLQAERDADSALRCRSDADQLADALGLDREALRLTLEAVGTYAAGTATDPLGRPGSSFELRPGTPCGYSPGYMASKNFGGLRVDTEGRVMDAEGTVIAGLWAVGEAAGMGTPGLGGATGFDGSLSAVVWSGWRTAAAIAAEPRAPGYD